MTAAILRFPVSAQLSPVDAATDRFKAVFREVSARCGDDMALRFAEAYRAMHGAMLDAETAAAIASLETPT
jgi:hypothetical protein